MASTGGRSALSCTIGSLPKAMGNEAVSLSELDDIGKRRPLILHIVDIRPNELRVCMSRDGDVLTYRRARTLIPRAAFNQTLQRTASRHGAQICVNRSRPRMRLVGVT